VELAQCCGHMLLREFTLLFDVNQQPLTGGYSKIDARSIRCVNPSDGCSLWGLIGQRNPPHVDGRVGDVNSQESFLNLCKSFLATSPVVN